MRAACAGAARRLSTGTSRARPAPLVRAGAQGPQGVQGPPGIGTVYGRSAGGPVTLPKAPGKKTVVSLTVPRGSYVITGKAVGGFSVNEPNCPPNSPLKICAPEEILERRIQGQGSSGCAVIAGASSDLGRANLITGGTHLSAFQTVSANVIHSFTGLSNKITLTCLQYGGGIQGVQVANARLIAMRVGPRQSSQRLPGRRPEGPQGEEQAEAPGDAVNGLPPTSTGEACVY